MILMPGLHCGGSEPAAWGLVDEAHARRRSVEGAKGAQRCWPARGGVELGPERSKSRVVLAQGVGCRKGLVGPHVETVFHVPVQSWQLANHPRTNLLRPPPLRCQRAPGALLLLGQAPHRTDVSAHAFGAAQGGIGQRFVKLLTLEGGKSSHLLQHRATVTT